MERIFETFDNYDDKIIKLLLYFCHPICFRGNIFFSIYNRVIPLLSTGDINPEILRRQRERRGGGNIASTSWIVCFKVVKSRRAESRSLES